MNIMNGNKKFVVQLAALCFVLFAVVSCNDDYDKHYSIDNSERIDLTVLDYLKTRSDLSKFVELLEFTGYADTLQLNQTYTVFALTNDALSEINMSESNKEVLKLFIGGHLTSYAQTSSVEMKAFNGKYLPLNKSGENYTYAGVNVKEPNILIKNGLVHVMEAPVPYVFNLWEFIENNEGLDSLKVYVNSLTEMAFDPDLSYDEDNIFIDSIYSEQNIFFNDLGDIRDELFLSTMIMPTNTAWKDTYEKLFSYYRSLDKTYYDGEFKTGEELQVDRTKWALVSNCIFNTLDIYEKDSLIATNGNVFFDQQYLFQGLTPFTLSNGYAYVTDELKFKPEEAWLTNIEVEAEQNTYNLRHGANCTLSTFSSFGTSVTASNNYFIRCEGLPTSDFSKISVSFPIPNTLSGVKYNIYCVFVPISALDPTDLRPYKTNIYMSYMNESGVKVTDKSMLSGVETLPGEMTKLLVAENFEFPYCDLISYNPVSYANEINVSLKVENAATVREERNGLFSRNLAIDCIILEPVLE